MKNITCYSLLFLLLSPVQSPAQDFIFDKEKGRAVPNFIGQIKLMKGKVFRKVKEEVQEVETGERFKLNDVVMTQEQSFVKILMIDDSVITLGPKSEMKLLEFDFKEKSDRSMAVELVKGQLGADIKNRAKPGQINFRTRYTSMGVRGTYFLMNHQSIGALDIAEYAVLEGKVEVNDEGGSTPLHKGEKITLIHDSEKKKSAKEALKLSQIETTDLNPKIDEDKEVKPFLPFFQIQDVRDSSPLNAVLSKNAVNEEKSESQTKKEAPRKNWKDSLKKLNEKLRERNKTR